MIYWYFVIFLLGSPGINNVPCLAEKQPYTFSVDPVTVLLLTTEKPGKKEIFKDIPPTLRLFTVRYEATKTEC